MKISVKQQSVDRVKGSCLVVPVFQDEFPGAVGFLDGDGRLRRLFSEGIFTGAGETLQLVVFGGEQSLGTILLVGLGNPDEYTLNRVRLATASAVRELRKLGIREALVLPFSRAESELPLSAVIHAQVVAALMADYRFQDFKPAKESKDLKELVFVISGRQDTIAARREIPQATAYGEAVNFARRLADLPGNVVNPEYLARTARELKSARIQVRVLDDKTLLRQKFGGIMAVGQGSANPPRLAVLEYKSGKRNVPKVVLVGKGVTFDSGGISLKPGAGMDTMKGDMAGAAAVLGVFSALDRLQPAVDVVGLVPAAENMPDGASYRPGDIIRAYSGKTVEILNTDAEGRLLLADALAYGESKFKPTAIIDMATLTGACVVALGHELTAVISNHQDLVLELVAAGSREGDPAWQLPLVPEFEKMVESKVADLRNTTNSRDAGTITAGAFLKAHLSQDTPWAHLDIAGTAWKKATPLHEEGPTGAPVRLLLNFLQSFQGWKE
jgi:leucyl aminopeptidase